MRKNFIGILVLSLLVLGHNGIGNASLSDGLVAYYPFNGNANDESGNGNNGTVYGASLTADRFGNANSAYQFDGTSSWIKVANSTTLNIHGCTGLSIAAWIKADKLNNWSGIVSKWGPGMGEDDQYGIGIENGKLRFFLSDEPTLIYGDISVGSWYFVVGKYDYTTGIISIYIDGNMFTQKLISFCIWDTNQFVEIGRHSDYYFFDGLIDDIRIYNRALSASEIQELYTGSAPQSCYDTGYAAGVAACKANPAQCGINVNHGTAVTLTPDLKIHLPNIQYNIPLLGSVSMWADLAYDGTKTDAGYFKVTGAGAN